MRTFQQIPWYLALDTSAAAEATFQMNYFHAEGREYHRTFCSAVIKFNPIRFAETGRQSAALDATEAPHGLARVATSGLARYADFPDGFKVRYRLQRTGNGRTWLVAILSEPATDPLCSLPDRRRYLEDGRLCSSALGKEMQWRRSGAVEADAPVSGR